MKTKLAGALAVVLFLSGCGAINQSGAAAVVGDKRLTVSEVNAAAEEIKATLAETDVAGGVDGLMINQTTLTLFVRYEVSKIMAQSLEVAATKSQIDKEHASLVSGQGGEENLAVSAAYSNIAPSNLRKYIETQLNFNNSIAALGDPDDEATIDMLAGMISAIVDEYGIDVSSRFGEWDMGALAVVSANSDVVFDLDLVDLNAE